MKKLIILLMVVGLVCAASADTLRYRGNGPWQDLDDGSHGWISPDAPDATDTVRANWGGATITLDYETTVSAFQAGVDESGTFHIQSGGILNAGNSKIGNNNACTGTMIIDAGGTVNANGGWLMVAGNSLVTGVADVSGTLNSAGHLWMATGTDSTALMDINAGGVVSVGGMIGLGTVNASTPSGGVATLNVNDGGLLALANIHGAGTSIFPGSMININGSGLITLPGDFVGVMTNLYIPSYVTGDGILGNAVATYDGIGDITTVTVPEPVTMVLFGLGGMLIRRKK